MPPEVTFRVALEEKREDVTGKRSREKGSKVILKTRVSQDERRVGSF